MPTQAPTKWRVTLGLDDLEAQHGLPSGLLTAVLRQESRGNPEAKSPAGAQGLFQLMPATAKQYGADPYDPAQAAEAAAQELRTLYTKYDGDLPSTIAAWNWGQGNLDSKGLEQAPKETTNFIKYITRAVGEDLSALVLGESKPAPSARPAPSFLQRAAGLFSPASAEAATGEGEDLSALVLRNLPQTSAGTPQARPPASVRLTPEMDDDAIMTALGYDPGLIKQSSAYQAGMLKKRITNPNSTYAKVMNSLFGLPGGIYQGGVEEPIHAGAQLIARGLRALGTGSDADVALQDLLTDLSTSDYAQNIRGGRVTDPQTGRLKFEASRLIGAVAVPTGPSLAAGRLAGQAAAGVGTSPVVQAMTRGAIQGAEGALEAPVEGARGQSITGAKAEQAGLGAGLGAALGPAAEYAATKIPNIARGVQPPEYRSLQEAGDQAGVRLSAADVATAQDLPNVSRLDVLGESVPGIGLAGFRRGQQGEAQAATETRKLALADALRQTPYMSLAQVQRAAATPGPRQARAQILITEMAQAGDDWQHILQVSGNVALFGKQLRSDALYERVNRLSVQAGRGLEPKGVMAVIASAMADAKNDILADPKTLAVVQQIAQRLPKKLTYAQAAALRSDLGDMLRHPGEVLGHKGDRALRQIREALEEDMYAFTQASGVPALARAARAANTYYRTQVVPYRDTALAKALSTASPDTVYKTFIKQATTPDQAQFFYEALDQRGRAAVRLGMIEEAIEAASAASTANAAGRFSPAKFAQYMERIQDSTGVFFQGQDAQQLQGFVKLLRHIPRASAYAENPPTGARQTLAFLLGVGANQLGVFSPTNIVYTAFATAVLRGLTTTRPGKAILLAASQLPDDAPGWQQLLTRAAPLVAARAGGRGIAEGTTVTPDITRR